MSAIEIFMGIPLWACIIIQPIILILKLVDVIEISWILVFVPLYVAISVLLLGFAFLGIMLCKSFSKKTHYF